MQLRGLQLDSLLNEGQYAHLADILFDLQTTVEQTDQSDLKNITATALQLCLFCQQCQTEMEWHRKADREVRVRLSELNGQLDTLLNSIVEYKTRTGTKQPDVSVSVTLLEDRVIPMVGGHPNLWQRIRDLFDFKTKSSNSERQMTKVVVNASFPSANEQDDKETHLDRIDKRLPLQVTTEADMPYPASADKTNIVVPAENQIETIEEVKKPANSVLNRELEDIFTVRTEEPAQSGKTATFLVVYCLGSFRVYQNDQLVQEWPSSKGKSIFKYLIAQRKQPVPKEVLMELFWPGAHPDAARNNLNVSIYGLRQALRNISPNFSHILFQEECYLLNTDMEFWIDVEEFKNRIQSGRQKEIRGEIASAMQEYQAAEALYQGEFLAEDRYEEWLVPQRQNLQDEYLKLLDSLSRYYIEQKDLTACLGVCTKMLAVDPCREEAHRRLMRCYCCQGQPYLALRQFHVCEDALRDELDLSPTETTKILYRQIREGKQVSNA